MKKFKIVTFDFQNNTISLNGQRIQALSLPHQRVAVRVKNGSCIPPRSEQIAIVTGNKECAFITSDFQTHVVPGCNSICINIYKSKAIVSLDVQGQFVITLVNAGSNAANL